MQTSDPRTRAWARGIRVAGARLRALFRTQAGRSRGSKLFPSLPAGIGRSGLSAVLALAGFALLAYVAVQYWSMLHTQRRLQAEWQREQQQPNTIVLTDGRAN